MDILPFHIDLHIFAVDLCSHLEGSAVEDKEYFSADLLGNFLN